MTKILKLFFLLLPLVSYSQNDTLHAFDNRRNIPLWGREITNSLLIGANHQSRGDTVSSKENRWFAEIGIHRTSMLYTMHGASTITYGMSALASFDKEKIVGFRAGIWTSYLLSVGLSMTYYTNLKQGNLKVTPEFGFGMGRLKFSVGYNIPTFRNKDFDVLRYANAQIMINYLIKVKRIKDERK